MADVISGTGRIILDGSGVEHAVFYWLTISDEPGQLVAEGSISASESANGTARPRSRSCDVNG